MANLTSKFQIAGRVISADNPPFIIAEISANHNGDIRNAKALISAAASAGADAVKIQTYTPDTITIDCNSEDFLIKDGLWAGHSLYELYEKAYTPWEWHEELFKCAADHDILIFSSPFDKTAVDLLEELGAPAYKIASFEAVDTNLIKYAASTGKPLIISTGMANLSEIKRAVSVAADAGCENIAVLHCVSGYPAPASDYNLRTIPDLKETLKVEVGLSDHTLDNTTALASIALGASIVEKHFTLNRSGGGPDDSFSLEPADLEALVESSQVAWSSLGDVDYSRKSSEEGNVKFRRSLYVVEDIAQGEKFTHQNIRSIRPGFGLAPHLLDNILGCRASLDIQRGQALKQEHIQGSAENGVL